jgi:molybdopterin-binding protein
MSKENLLFSKLPIGVQEAVKAFLPDWPKLKTELAEVPAPIVPVKLGETTLQDGTVIKYTGDSLAVGSELILVTAEGEVPAPEGDLVLADGSTVTVSIQDGKSVVSVITPVDPNAVSEDMKQEVNKQVSERVTKIVEKFESQFAAQKIEIENLKLKLGKVSATLINNTDMLIAFSEVETAEPIEKPDGSEAGTKRTKAIGKFLNNVNKK